MAPSLLACDFAELGEEIRRVERAGGQRHREVGHDRFAAGPRIAQPFGGQGQHVSGGIDEHHVGVGRGVGHERRQQPSARTEIEHAYEAVIEHAGKGSKMQLAQQKDQDGPIDIGNALWKLYVNTDDIEATYQAALDGGASVVAAPQRMDRWPVTIAFVADPDGTWIELIEHQGA